MEARWPEADLRAMQSGGSWYMGSAVCRRGHVETDFIDPRRSEQRALAENCTTCGARVLTACPTCSMRIRGDYFVPGVVGVSSARRPSFCDSCGAAFPWATREERIFELENLLDEEEIDEADRVVIQDHLSRLRSASLSEKDETRAWGDIAKRAGGAIKSPPVQRVVEGLVSAAIRAQLGI